MGVYISKVTSRGQVTLPQDFRKQAGISSEDYVAMRRAGQYLVLGKAELRWDEVTAEFRKEAKARGITKKELLEELERVKQDLYGPDRKNASSSTPTR
ncbi:MAG: AbrB/MazE/SpoVT family DNA-binding domain-containing protein [Candidatus Micrarchaeota archaeon]